MAVQYEAADRSRGESVPTCSSWTGAISTWGKHTTAGGRQAGACPHEHAPNIGKVLGRTPWKALTTLLCARREKMQRGTNAGELPICDEIVVGMSLSQSGRPEAKRRPTPLMLCLGARRYSKHGAPDNQCGAGKGSDVMAAPGEIWHLHLGLAVGSPRSRRAGNNCFSGRSGRPKEESDDARREYPTRHAESRCPESLGWEQPAPIRMRREGLPMPPWPK